MIDEGGRGHGYRHRHWRATIRIGLSLRPRLEHDQRAILVSRFCRLRKFPQDKAVKVRAHLRAKPDLFEEADFEEESED